MKNKNVPNTKKIRFFINIFCLLSISSVFIFTPTTGHVPGTLNPAVKAAYISEPETPIGKDIPAPDLSASSVYIVDLTTGIVLFDKNPHERLKPASLTKIMTALVSLDYFPQDYVLSVINGQKSVGATAKLVKGDKLTFESMMEALLIPSGNDAAVTLAENYPGGYAAFVAKMNSKVQELGLLNSHFSNVSGIEGPNHYTSAYDIAMIAESALKRNLFQTIVSTQKVTIISLKGYRYPVETTNKLLGEPGVLGVKTGWTPEAGECLVTLVTREGHPILVSLLNSKNRFGESESLINWVYQNYDWL
jgi:D-alanyl-D-alanine carboxypeptidase (penicillin-binding protein 5/6)